MSEKSKRKAQPVQRRRVFVVAGILVIVLLFAIIGAVWQYFVAAPLYEQQMATASATVLDWCATNVIVESVDEGQGWVIPTLSPGVCAFYYQHDQDLRATRQSQQTATP